LGKSAHGLSAASGGLRGGDGDGLGNDDCGHQEQSGERRPVAHSDPAVQEQPFGGQAAERRWRPGTRRLSAPMAAPVQARI